MLTAAMGIAGIVAAFFLGRRTASRAAAPPAPPPIGDSAQMKRDFVANVSHELKTPITLIQGFIETLRGGAINDKETALEFLAIMDAHTTHMTAIINDLLELSKIEFHEQTRQLKQVKLPLVPVIEAAVRSAELRYPKFPSPDFSIESDLAVEIFPGLAEQAIYNLIDNALVHGGAQAPIRIRMTVIGKNAVISITDNGPGIAAEHQPRIFERFYQADPARTRKQHGSGLGLAIVKHIMSLHNGTVELKSSPGSGATFSLLFPL